tara:strand:+ start:160 stop:1077 length:918 start_codon:yes stop_codon:yes gene_type:complete
MKKVSYYSLCWNSKKNYTLNITENQILSDEFYINTVKLRKSKIEVKIYGKIKDNNNRLVNNELNLRFFKNIPLLKSNLQKAIRRGDVNSAVITAYNLMNVSFWEFIRRIIIISIEDVYITENIGFLAWCMISYPNFNITNEIKSYLLATVYSMTTHPTHIHTIKNNVILTNIDYESYIHDDIKFPLLIRMEYGGLKGDIKMIQNILKNPINSNNLIKIISKDIRITANISYSDIIPQSIDFHIYPTILDELVKLKKIYERDLIKKLIWCNSSCINYRVKHKPWKQKEWNLIKNDFIRLQKTYKIY